MRTYRHDDATKDLGTLPTKRGWKCQWDGHRHAEIQPLAPWRPPATQTTPGDRLEGLLGIRRSYSLSVRRIFPVDDPRQSILEGRPLHFAEPHTGTSPQLINRVSAGLGKRTPRAGM